MSEEKILSKIEDLKVAQAEIITYQKQHAKDLTRHADLLEKQQELLLRNTITVEEHHKRSTALEESFKLLKAEVDKVKGDVTGAKTSAKAISGAFEIIAKYAGWGVAAIGVLWQLYVFLKSKGL